LLKDRQLRRASSAVRFGGTRFWKRVLTRRLGTRRFALVLLEDEADSRPALLVRLLEMAMRTLDRAVLMRTTDLVQRLQVARRELGLEAAITKLDKYQLLILDDIAYVTKDQAETSVLFELIATRNERRSLLITANQPFGEWGKIFSD